MNAFSIVADFEKRVAEYAGSKYGVATDCCTMALFLCLKYCQHAGLNPKEVDIPARTYASVPMAAIHAGFKVRFVDRMWVGRYELEPLPIVDGAKRFRRGMYEGGLHCLSFHAKKILAIGRGGMILTDDEQAVKWLRKARYDGREGKPYPEEQIDMLGWHCYMTPEQAARGMLLMDILPENPQDHLEDYPDLRTMPVFRGMDGSARQGFGSLKAAS